MTTIFGFLAVEQLHKQNLTEPLTAGQTMSGQSGTGSLQSGTGSLEISSQSSNASGQSILRQGTHSSWWGSFALHNMGTCKVMTLILTDQWETRFAAVPRQALYVCLKAGGCARTIHIIRSFSKRFCSSIHIWLLEQSFLIKILMKALCNLLQHEHVSKNGPKPGHFMCC